MKHTFTTLALAIMPLLCMAQYHADVFVDGGISLNKVYDYPVFNKMGLSVEKFLSSQDPSEIDTMLQKSLLHGNEWDENGILLYPDGSPRYKFIYINRGKAGQHGQSLETAGRTAIENFVKAGGGYVGTCAAAFLVSRFLMKDGTHIPKSGEYLAIWPGTTESTDLGESYTSMILPADSPLTKTEQAIDSIPHDGGCFALETMAWPQETEVLARYNTTGRTLRKDIDGKPAVWAYRQSKTSGRIVVGGSQIEQCDTPEALWLMEGMIRYAMDANPKPTSKGELSFKEKRYMTCKNGNPSEARIGDGQYHYFTVNIPKNKNVTISLTSLPGWKDFDLYLYGSKDNFATPKNAQVKNETSGVDKEITLENLEPGTYYITVYCATQITPIETSRGTQYTGRLDVLNGVPYIISLKQND